MIGKTIDISVTSVLQTTAGKMIFGKWDERNGSRHDSRPAVNAVPAVPSVSAVSGVQSAEVKKPQPVMVERPVE
jgi:hypothetical protein